MLLANAQMFLYCFLDARTNFGTPLLLTNDRVPRSGDRLLEASDITG